jgi:tryptophan-rich sensory protein
MWKLNQWAALAGFIVLCLAAGALGGLATAQSVTVWYPTLTKPTWNPPAWVFAPVWTTLYVLMALAAWRVWRRGAIAKSALQLFIVQLALNVAWSFIFFGARNPGLAFAEIIVLWLAIIATTRAFWRLSQPAGMLMLPYIVWVSFAAVLNFTVWRLNA